MRDEPKFLGPRFNRNIPTRNKILAADGVPGLVMMLAYYAGGRNMFPRNINPDLYLLEPKDERKPISTDVGLLGSLQEEISLSTGYEVGQLGLGSMSVYLSLLRNGFRANRQGNFPPIKNEFSKVDGTLLIHARSFDADVESGVWNLVPDWVKNLNREAQ